MASASAGTTFAVSISSVFTTVAKVRSISGPNITVADIDTTILLSTDAFKEFIAGFADGGVVQIEAFFAKAQLTTLYGMIRASQSWKITFVEGSTWAFSGHINAIGTVAELEDAVTMPFAIKISGKPVFTAAA